MKNRTMPYASVGRSRKFSDKLAMGVEYDDHPGFKDRPRWKNDLHRIIFGNTTFAGRTFDVILIMAILISVMVVMLESVQSINDQAFGLFRILEWVFTAAFTLEYILRLVAAERSSRYARSFFGIVDLLAILPTFLSVIVPGAQAGAVLRILRILRVFRVLKLAQFIGGERMLIRALRSSVYKIAVFLIAVLTVVTVFGSAMYFIEGAEAGFTSIPRSVYWAIVTLTTVGFGDITPLSPLGQMVSAMIMILGYGIIAVPTGIVTAGMIDRVRVRGTAPARKPGRTCASCGRSGHSADGRFCCYCSMELPS